MRLFCTGTKATKSDSSTILYDLNNLLKNDDFDNTFLPTHVLNKIIQFTESEFGFIAFLNPKGELCGHTCSDFAWNDTIRELLTNEFNQLKFPMSYSVFSTTITNQEVCIDKNPSSFLPQGHPVIRQIMCAPIYIDDSEASDGLPVRQGLVCVCNKFEPYSKKNTKSLTTLLETINDIIKKYISIV